jgi:serine/threonine-protein kinase
MGSTDSSQTTRRLIELLCDKFAFLSILGHGGSGTVYEVRNLHLGRVEALKVLTNTSSIETTRRFIHEAKVSASLDHPSIVKVYDFGQLDDINWYSMQLIEGPSLSTLIENGVRLDPTGFSRLTIPLLDALAYTHRQGVIHRDIKPGNILLHKNGYPCLTDFGIAKSHENTDFTQTGNMVGTPAYMSPEQAEGRHVDGRTDQYSLAITMYRAITGRLPFSSVGTLETLVQRLKEDPEPLDWHCPNFPAPLRHVLMKSLSRNRDDRYMTVGDMQSAMQRASDSCGIHWSGPVDGFDHLEPVARKPLDSPDSDIYDDMDLTATSRNAAYKKFGVITERPIALAVMGSLAIASALAAFFYFRERAVGQQPQTGEEATPSQVSIPSGPPPEVEHISGPKPKPNTEPAKPPSAPLPVVTRIPVSRPKLIENHVPQSITVPPEMIGKLIRVRVWVGEDGKVSRCAILDKDIGPDIKTIATAIAMNMVFSPALDGDDKPIASDTVVAFSL